MQPAIRAGWRRVIGQLLTESILLAAIGAAAGVVVWLKDSLVALAREGSLPQTNPIVINYGVLAFAVAVTIVTSIPFGLAPALPATKVNIEQALKQGGRTATDGVRSNRLRHALIGGEVALALVLLTGSGLMIRCLLKTMNIDPGFNPQNVLAMR